MSDKDFGRGITNDGFGRGVGSGFGRGFGTPEKELTQTQREMIPFMQYVREQEGEEGKKLKPLQWIFDRLQTGQYVTANAVNAALENLNENEPAEKKIIDILSAMGRGLTGKEKGNYADIIKTHATGGFQEFTEKELIPGRDDDKLFGQATMADLLGLAGDIFLDPFTYIGGGLAGKSGKAAKKAASTFAEDSVRVAVKQMAKNIGAGQVDDLARIAQAGIDPAKFAQKMAKNADEGVEYLIKAAGGDVSKQMNDIYKTAYKTALNTPADELEKLTQKAIEPFELAHGEAVSAAREKVVGALGKSSDALEKARGGYNAIMEAPTPLQSITDNLVGRYGGGGQRYVANLFGHEFGTKVRGPGFIEGSMDRMGQAIKNSPAGNGLSNAWWAVTQNGPVGEIRKALGVRNPYEKMVRLNELQEGSQYFLRKAQENLQNVRKATEGHSDEVKQWYVAANDLAETLTTKRQTFDVFDVIGNPMQMEKIGLPAEAADEVRTLATDVTTLMRSWHKEYMDAEAKGYVDTMGFIENYLPSIMKDPAIRKGGGVRKVGSSAKPGFAKARAYTRSESAKMEANKLKWLFKNLDLSDDQAVALVKKYNVSNVQMDLDELLAARAYSQAMVSKRANLMDTFKEFGVPLRYIEDAPDVQKALFRAGQNVTELGLKSVPEKGLKGYLFDKNVADVFGRIAEATSGGQLKKTRAMFKKYTSWWKGIVTMTPGFHARNWLSNNVTGFMNHGAKWMNPVLDRDSTVAAVYAISKNNPGDVLEQIGMKVTDYNRILNKSVGGSTIRELADDSIRSGLISEAQMGFSAKEVLASAGKKMSLSPFNPEFGGKRASQKLGSVIENGSKFKSFLIDFEDLMKQAPTDAAAKANFRKTAEQASTMNAKKWFIDYEDLTPFERNTMKNVIPFYTWLRRNLANQIEGIIYHPDIYAMFPKVQEALTQEDPQFEQGLVPDWLSGGASIPIGNVGDETLMYRMDMPFMDLNKIPLKFEPGKLLPRLDVKDLKDELVNAAHPALKQIASLATEKGYDFFKGKELDDWEDAPYALQLLLSNPKTYEWLDGFLRMSGSEEGLKIRRAGKKIEIDPRMAQVIENAIPFLRQLNFLIYTPTQLIPGLEETLERVSGIEDDYNKLEQGLQLISYYTGIKNYPVNLGEETQKRSRRQYYEARDLRTEDKKRLPGYDNRNSQKSKDSIDAIIERLEAELW